jgi:hypothetical protein
MRADKGSNFNNNHRGRGQGQSQQHFRGVPSPGRSGPPWWPQGQWPQPASPGATAGLLSLVQRSSPLPTCPQCPPLLVPSPSDRGQGGEAADSAYCVPDRYQKPPVPELSRLVACDSCPLTSYRHRDATAHNTHSSNTQPPQHLADGPCPRSSQRDTWQSPSHADWPVAPATEAVAGAMQHAAATQRSSPLTTAPHASHGLLAMAAPLQSVSPP